MRNFQKKLGWKEQKLWDAINPTLCLIKVKQNYNSYVKDSIFKILKIPNVAL